MSEQQWEDALDEDALFSDANADEYALDADAWDLEDNSFAADGFGELDAFSELEELDIEGFGEDALGKSTELRLPPQRNLVTGPRALAIARQLNPLVLAALHAEDADAFMRMAGQTAQRGAASGSRNARGGGQGRPRGRPGLARLLRIATPAIEHAARTAGPWGMAISAGLGAARGLAEGGGFRGALAGAVGGVVPGVGGRIASQLIRGQSADNADDDEAALETVADMADARQIPEAVALLLGAGLATRVLANQSMQHVGAAAPPAARGVWTQARAVERTMLQGAAQLPGGAGQQVRLMGAAAQLAVPAAAAAGSPRAVATALPAAAQTAMVRVQQHARKVPQAGASSPAEAARRLEMRRRILGQMRNLLGQWNQFNAQSAARAGTSRP